MTSYRESIDKPKAQMLRFMHDNRKRIEKATGLTIVQADDKPLGCGGYGCAYATNNKRWVVKVSSDATEAALVKSVMDVRAEKAEKAGDGTGPSTALPGVVFFEGIWMRPDRRGKTMFVFVRENVEPFQDEDVLLLDWFGSKGTEHPNVRSKYGTSALNLAVEYAADFYDAKEDQAAATDAIDSYLKWIEVVRPEMPLVSEAMEEFVCRGVVLRDVHDRNVGRTLVDWGKKYRPKGSVVIFDLGCTPTDHFKGYSKLNPVLSKQDAEKLMSRQNPRQRAAEKAVIDSTRGQVAAVVHSKWTWPVKIPRL